MSRMPCSVTDDPLYDRSDWEEGTGAYAPGRSLIQTQNMTGCVTSSSCKSCETNQRRQANEHRSKTAGHYRF